MKKFEGFIVSETAALDLVKIKISHLIKFASQFAGIEIHLPVSGKYVKLNYASEQFIDILRKLQQKEVEEVFVTSVDCKKILLQIQDSLSSKNFYDPETVTESKVDNLEASMQVVKSVIKSIGVDKETIDLMKTINHRAMTLLSEAPTVFSFVKKFKKNCSEEFLHSVLTSYIMSLIIDKFPWKTDLVKEKGALAAMLCDVTLEKEDFLLIRKYEQEGGKLPERILKHSVDIAENLRQKTGIIPSETITIIEQHHELPDGKGFPYGITASRFNQLSTIFIIGQRFVELLVEENFNFDKRHEIISKLHKTYNSKSFEKAIDALVSVVDN